MTTINALYDYLGLSAESVSDDMKSGYLTINTAADGRDYFYYFDGVQECAACVENGLIVSDGENLKNLFPWFE